MPTKSVNITLSTPFGNLRIYSDPKQQAKAERLITRTPSILTEGYRKGTEKFGNQLLRMVRKCLNTGVPPRGVSWPPHSAATVKRYGEHTLLKLTGQYVRSITIVKMKNRTFVGLPIGVHKVTFTGKVSKKTLNQVAIILEYGSRDGYVPPRPLWSPSYEAIGGKEVLKQAIVNELRKGIRKEINGI